MRTYALIALLLLTAGCGENGPACTMIGASPGINVTVQREVAAELTDLALTVCWGGACQDYPVALDPGYDSVDQGCDGTGPDAACSATAVPNQTLVGFVEIRAMPSLEVTVSATFDRAGVPTKLPATPVQAATYFPNGPQCPPSVNQAQVRIGPDGIR